MLLRLATRASAAVQNVNVMPASIEQIKDDARVCVRVQFALVRALPPTDVDKWSLR
jgi:hypothetical protein